MKVSGWTCAKDLSLIKFGCYNMGLCTVHEMDVCLKSGIIKKRCRRLTIEVTEEEE